MRWAWPFWWRGPTGPSFPPIVRPRRDAVTAPPQLLTNARTLIDGQYREAGAMLTLNGLTLTEGLDYTRTGGRVEMITPPTSGDILAARIFAIGDQLGGSSPTRYIAPWSFRLTGPFDGIGTSYRIEYGPTITGPCDGRNQRFTWSCQISRGQVYRNGILQTAGVDVSIGQTAMVFMPGAIPQPGDLLALLGYG